MPHAAANLCAVCVLALVPPIAAAQAVTCVEDSKLDPSGVGFNDIFGFAISMDNDLAAVAALWDDDKGSNAGAVYIFRLESGHWVQEAKLTASDGGAEDVFGRSVALDSGTLVVGANGDDDNGFDAGAAYVFVREAPGEWAQQAKLKALDGGPIDRMGWACDVSGDLAVVSAHREDAGGEDSGAAYVFRRGATGAWAQEAKLKASDAAADDEFSQAVAIDGDYAIIGAFEDVNAQGNTGAAYVFRRSPIGQWSQLQKIVPANAATGDAFGRAVAMDGQLAVIGSPFFHPLNYGGAYAYVRQPDGTYQLEEQLQSSTPQTQAWLGRSVSIRDGLAVIGGAGSGSGPESSAVFARVSDGPGSFGWEHMATLDSSDHSTLDLFGSPVATDGVRVLVGAQWDDDKGGDSGSVYVYDGDCFAPPVDCPYDIDGNLVVDSNDLQTLLATFGQPVNPFAFGDVDGSGLVDSTDLNLMLSAFGDVCE